MGVAKPCRRCGKVSEMGARYSYCCGRPTNTERMLAWRHANKDYANARDKIYQRKYRAAYPERVRETAARSHHKDPSKKLFLLAKARARKAGLPFNIERSGVVIPKRCPVLGIKIVVGGGTGFQDASPTLDRVDNKRGYVKGNIVVVSWRANRIKCDATLAELKALVRFYGQRRKAWASI